MSEVKIKAVALKDLEDNKGQLIGLPKNPRFIRDERYARTLQSIREYPGMMALRELLVYPLPKEDGKRQKYIVIAGNQRFRALKELGEAEAPCKIIPDDTDIDQLKAYTIKDNAQFGQWDMNMLANEWDRGQLVDYGLDVLDAWNDETKEQDFDGSNTEIDVDDFEEDMTLTIHFTKPQMQWVTEKLAEIDEKPTVALLKAAGWVNV